MTPYEILGVSSDATAAEIKTAYRRLAKGNHPDLVGGDGEERMKAVNAAYEILSDPRRRKRYDETGSEKDRDVRKAAEQCLMSLFDSYLEGEREIVGDLVDALTKQTQRIRMRLKTEVAQRRSDLRKLEKRAKRLKGPQLFRKLAEHKVSKKKQELHAAEEEIEVADVVLEMLKEYSDLAPEKEEVAGKRISFYDFESHITAWKRE